MRIRIIKVFILALVLLLAACESQSACYREVYYYEADEWVDLGMIKIPSTLSYDIGGLHGSIRITGDMLTSHEGIWGDTWMYAGWLLGDIDSLMVASLSAESFLFDDGHLGYFLTDASTMTWVREDGALLILRHGGDMAIFTDNEELILKIARTLTTPSIAAPTEIYAVNPFAIPLLDYFADGVEVPDDWTADSTKAFWADITGSGRPGVVAIKHIVPNDWTFAVARAFYFADGKLIYKDIGGEGSNIEGFPFAIGLTAEGMLVKVTGDGGNWSYTLFGNDGHESINILTYQLTIYGEMIDDERYNFFRFPGGWEEGLRGGRSQITEEEFEAYRMMFGLDNILFWPGIEDETEQILTMMPRFSVRAIEDFLYPLHTIFSYGTSRDSGALISYELLEGTWFNRHGEPIDQPWFVQYSTVPWGFSLLDFDNNGIPEILIYYGGLHFGGPPFPAIYRFIDGRYTQVIQLNRMPDFFTDRDGRIIVHYNVDYGGAYGYYHLIFTDDGAQKMLISEPSGDDWAAWQEHHQYPYFQQNPTIFGMPEKTLTPILPLTELENRITESVMRRHGLYLE